MCLISQQLKPFIAKKDLKVFKILVKTEQGNYETPYQHCKVELNSLMQANDGDEYEAYNWGDSKHKCQLQINGGFIHSLFHNIKDYLGSNEKVCILTAYIPEGTEYFIGTGFMDVCSKQLRLTDEFVGVDNAVLTDKEVMDIISPICESVSKEKVDAGWLVKSDKTFIHPSEYTDKMKPDIIGVVGSIINGNTIVLALDEAHCEWCKENEKVDNMPLVASYKQTYEDFNGKEYTDIIKNNENYQEDNSYLPAFDYCLKYKTKGTESGDWYLPSSGELHRMLNMNRDVLNYAFFILGTELIKYGTLYWASAEYNSANAWYCSTTNAFMDCWNLKWYRGEVRPSFAIKAQ